jgi:hypothetical protein
VNFTSLNLTTANGTALKLGVTNFDADAGTISATNGPAIDANGAFIFGVFSSVTSSGSPTNGINLVNTTGMLTIQGGSIPNAGGTAVNVLGGTIDLYWLGSTTQNASQFAISVSGSTGGFKNFNGPITSTGSGKGISLTGNTGATIKFNGTINLSTGANTAFSATGGGTVEVGGVGSTITTTTATAVNIVNTNIEAGGVTFQSVSSSGGSSTGIVLDTTGAAGGFTITGTGTPGSGGTIAGKTGSDGDPLNGVGIYLNSTTNPSFARMQLNDFQNYAIRGVNVTGFALDNSVVSGTNGTLTSGSGEGDLFFTGMLGSASVTNSTFSGAAYDTFRVENLSGQSLNRLVISNCTFGAMGTSGHDAMGLHAQNGLFNVTVTGTTVTSARSDMLGLSLQGTVVSDLVLGGASAPLGNTFANANGSILAGKGGITLASLGAPAENVTLTYLVQNNAIRGAVGSALLVSKGTGSGGSFTGTIDSNTIGMNGTSGSGSTTGDGIAVSHVQNGNSSVGITNNLVYGVSGTAPIHAFVTDDTNGAGKLAATVQGNTVATVGSPATAGIFLEAGVTGLDLHKACFTVGGAGALQNSVNLSGTTATDGIRVNQTGSTHAWAGGPTTAAGVQALIASQNSVTNTGGSALPVRVTANIGFEPTCPP